MTEQCGADFGRLASPSACQVVLYHIPPFVMITDSAATVLKDPGNFDGVRSVDSGHLSGFTMEFLQELEQRLQAKFEYVYPCLKTAAAAGACGTPSKSMALQMAKGGADAAQFVGGVGFCSDYNCFVAGAVKIDEPTIKEFFLTQPYIENVRAAPE